MKFGLAISSDIDFSIVIEMSNDLEKYFANKYYGKDIKMYTIGIICVGPQFEQFFKQQKPRYIKGKKEISQHGISIVIEDAFSYDIKLDFETFKNLDSVNCRRMVAAEILKSLNIFGNVKFKMKDFDFSKFKVDLEKYFHAHEYLVQ